jgi:hypothetical protein
VVSVLATGPKVRGFKSVRGQWIFKSDKNPQHHFHRSVSKSSVTCRRFYSLLKNPSRYESEVLRGQNSSFLSPVTTAPLLGD